MGEFVRGTVKKATFVIEYPDGRSKIYEVEDPHTVRAILFHPDELSEDELPNFNISDSEWEENPTMVVRAGQAGPTRMKYYPCRGKICF